MKLLYISAAALLCCALACKTAKPTTNATTAPATVSNDNATAGKGGNYILAVILKASRKQGDSAIVFEITNVTKQPGKLKPGQNDNSGEDYLISFAGADNVAINTYHVKNPLDTWIESSDESGKLQTTPVKKDEEYISVRTNYTPAMKKIIIKKNKNTDANKTIITLNVE